MDAEFCLLGPLQVRCGGELVRVPPGKQRAVLVALLLQANRVVTADELVDVMWGTTPPPTARAGLHNCVKRLRDSLGTALRARICTEPGGYMITLRDGELDVAGFEARLHEARAAARAASWDAAARQARAALALWRGQPLADVASEELAVREAGRLAELRLQAAETYVGAMLQLGRHSDVIEELRRLVADAPLREHLHALLMTALYRDGRQAEALAAFQHVRSVLVEELGTEPGPELQQLQQRILAADPALARRTSLAAASQTAEHVVPRELPAPVRHFTGREAELSELSDLAAGGGGRALVISAIGGTAGVGKTALAVQWAHQAAGRFPDGQLYVNLRGYDPGEPVAATHALAGFLRALGVPGTGLPDSMEDRARLYRSRLAGRRVLVLLDNARDGAQVRPLLPGDPGCVAVVTSRDALAGLVATDGARRLDLDVLPLADAVALLRSLIGARVDADQGATETLAGQCARLPLALRIAAELAAARPAVPLAELVAELAADRLDLLDGGEDRADVRAVFSWSLRHLPDDAAGAFALIGLHPGADLDVYAAAALTGTTAGQARRMLGRLHRASLLQAALPGRSSMHDLLRAYAREQAVAVEQDAARGSGGQCDQALTRLFDYYLAAAAAAMDTLSPADAGRRPRVAATAAAVPEMPGEAEARAWLDAERASLVAVVAYCARHGWFRHAADLAGTLFRYLMTGSYLPEALTIYGHALQAARQSGDVAAEAAALNGMGGISFMKGHPREAAGHYEAALERYRQCGDREGEARVFRNLGNSELQLHNHQSAARYYRQAITAYSDTGDSLSATRALTDLAAAEIELGSYDQASDHLQQALPVLRAAHDQVFAGMALAWMGELSLRRGQLTQAAEYFEQALAICRSIDHAAGVATGLWNLGCVSVHQGEYGQAIGYLRQALALHRETGYQHGEITTLRTLAEALDAAGQPAAARAELEKALWLTVETGNTYQQASVHCDLAESRHRAGEDERARQHWQQALDLYTQLGSPEADQVRSRLSPATG
jgi:DNA-binding SARP family transcriptional activator/tetratricopeptide (TPR) repeat protein